MIERLDTTLVTAWLFLMAVGMVFIASIDSSVDSGSVGLVLRQGIFAVVGLAVFATMMNIPLAWWQRNYLLSYLLAITLVLLVLVPGVGIEKNGATRWIDLTFFTVQPSEICRFLIIVAVSGYLAMFPNRVKSNPVIALLPLCALAPILALIYLQPDYGSVVLLGMTALGLLFIAGARMGLLLLLGGSAIAGLVVLLMKESYRIERVLSFLNPFEDPYGIGYQLSQSLIAFGRAGPKGLGLGDGVQKLKYLPEAHNDFIYAVIVEETGLYGAIGLIALMCCLIFRLFNIGKRALEARLLFAGYIAYGTGMMLAMQFAVNVGVAVGILPTKGLTLPFVSFGGNSLLVCCALVGLAGRASFETSHRSSLRQATT